MNKNIPFFAFTIALFSIIFFYAGLPVAFTIIPLAATFFLALLGMFFADPDKPVSSRIACLAAVVMAALPFIIPVLKSWRFSQLSAARTQEIRPIIAEMKESFKKDTHPVIEQFYKEYGYFPDVQDGKILPLVSESGALIPPPEGASIEEPADPFLPDKGPMRWVRVPGEGVLVVSVGQDGVAEMPLPGVLIDPPPAHPLYGFALLGVDPREVTFDLDKGGLSLGDIPMYHGRKNYEETFKPLFDAWDLIHKRAPYRPTPKRGPADPDDDPQSTRDSIAALSLLKDKEYLAAASLASRGMKERHKYVAQWTPEDFQLDYIRGMALYQLAAYREAADSLVNYLTGNPNDVTAHYYLGAALFFGGNRQDAITHLEAASQISVSDPLGNEALARLQELQARQAPKFPVAWWVEELQRRRQAPAAGESP